MSYNPNAGKTKINFNEAWYKINRTLRHIRNNGVTEVYEVTSYSLNNLDN